MDNDYVNAELELETDKKTSLEMDLLLDAIYQLSGFDFKEYARSSIYRRIQHRMKMNHLATITSVLEKVIHDEMFLQQLLNDLSINVTEMFRNPSFFKTFRNEVVPLLRNYPEIRIWHAGCSSGEEVLSMSILMEEEGLRDRTVLYATDMNKDILTKAKTGVLPLHKMQMYTKNYMQAGGTDSFSKYYDTDNRFAYFQPSLLRNVIFAQHNLVTDQSFNEFHVIICRNVLIYFTSELQNKVHQLFYESLCTGGILGLGDKETLRFTQTMPCYKKYNDTEQLYQKL